VRDRANRRMLVFSVTSLSFFENIWTSTNLGTYVVPGGKSSLLHCKTMKSSAFQPLPPPYDTITRYPTVG